MSEGAIVGLLAATIAIVPALFSLMLRSTMRSIRAEVHALRAEINASLALVTSKMDLHVIDRLDRIEREQAGMRKRLHDDFTPAISQLTAKLMILEERVGQLRAEAT